MLYNFPDPGSDDQYREWKRGWLMSVNSKVREIRLKRNLSLKGLAQLVGVSPSFISQVELGKASPSINTLRRIAGSLNVELAYLLDEESVRDTVVKYSVTIINSLKCLSIIADFIAAICRTHDLAKEHIDDILLAVDEAVSNIINHGYPVTGIYSIKIDFQFHFGKVVVKISDQGRPFDPTMVKTGNFPATIQDRQEGHLGIHFIRRFMDSMDYNYNARTETNQLVLEKTIPRE
ncbi:MAG: hypothetical protein CVV64_18205 [Candidatus Wallbacteria bacterium HGW-Wallbacteria-1]|jgi:anti-sigma regulatory factor (Ser/Thr protein kinase)/DNA-binding Xre family transcriptional regulator|uniref:HTH cro/C1-type domain-containing protein n=1 Tax=Candidatus Wallbacteria bacterium HGW-Wallbacteria-1 TaxID=2013854 RepID=A0A2N1PJR5_9BACT|nr:MAG: hypothetical protein CVV64_18205 [Candidatus Wallbacteria bacterium HGW-Wallbacteria-1]